LPPAASTRPSRHADEGSLRQRNAEGVGAALTDHIAIIVLGNGRWRLIKNRLSIIGAAVAAAAPGSFAEIDIPID
jgi:undecaprenyl pyrophosphate synthase